MKEVQVGMDKAAPSRASPRSVVLTLPKQKPPKAPKSPSQKAAPSPKRAAPSARRSSIPKEGGRSRSQSPTPAESAPSTPPRVTEQAPVQSPVDPSSWPTITRPPAPTAQKPDDLRQLDDHERLAEMEQLLAALRRNYDYATQQCKVIFLDLQASQQKCRQLQQQNSQLTEELEQYKAGNCVTESAVECSKDGPPADKQQDTPFEESIDSSRLSLEEQVVRLERTNKELLLELRAVECRLETKEAVLRNLPDSKGDECLEGLVFSLEQKDERLLKTLSENSTLRSEIEATQRQYTKTLEENSALKQGLWTSARGREAEMEAARVIPQGCCSEGS